MTNPFAPGPLVAEIIASLRDEPEKWSVYSDQSVMLERIDEKGKLPLWSVRTDAFVRGRGRGEIPTTIIERFHLRRAVRAWKRRS